MLQQRAARDSARAAVSQTRAALASSQIDLDRSVIRSPIDGVVVDRQVDPGQSVAASFQAPILFIIAQDLSRLQANITVDEADIGDVRQDMAVRFTADAYPDSQFEGRVSQVRQQGAQESGVVSYTVVVEADNPGRRLLPGMTANADIVIEEQHDVLRLPNAALRFRPADPRIESLGQAVAAESGPQAGGARGERGGERGGGGGRGIAQLTEALQLTEAQQETARQAAQQMMQAGARPGPDMSQADRRAFGRRMREAALAAVEPSLSAEQRALLEQMQAAGPETRREVRRQAVAWVLRRGQPVPVSIEVGIADSGFTVLLGGELEEGDEVIIGGGPAAREQSGSPMGGGNVRIRGT
jgi:HlyD family secretion protein